MIRINCNDRLGKADNFWNNIHFHPTDAIEDDWGKAILDSVASDGVAKTVRMYAMLEDIVSMDADGNFRYDFTENDVRMDYVIGHGFNVFLSYNFLPPCLVEDTDNFQHASKRGTRYKGKMICTSRLRDEGLWEEVCYRYTEHIVERYGQETVGRWYLQCYNEPDIPMFFMTELGMPPENLDERVAEYMRLYRGFVRGVGRVSTSLRVGGPATSGILPFCQKFLAAVKSEGLKFDFFSGHSYGTDPNRLNSGEGFFAIENILNRVRDYRDILNEYFPDAELVIDEWGASACGFYDREECPRLLFREGSEYAAYFGKLVEGAINAGLGISKLMICLSGQHDLPCDFSGCRNFMGKNLIKKPIYNAYALMRRLHGLRVGAESDVEGLTALATVDEGGNAAIMLTYASQRFDTALPDVCDTVTVSGITGKKRVTVWCIDKERTNPYTHAQKMGWGDLFDSEQIAALRQIGEMKPVAEYEEVFVGEARIPLEFTSDALLMITITE